MARSLANRLQPRLPSISVSRETAVPIDFGEWKPDQPDFGSGGSLLCRNVIPGPGVSDYKPVRDLVNISTNALDNVCLGATTARDKDNNLFVYAGNETKLYELRDNAFTDESKAGGYSTGAEDVWEFAVWDRDQRVIATNFSDPIQVIGTGTGTTSLFSDLITSTNKPTAKHIDVVRDFLVLGHTNDTTDGVRPSRVWWSAIGNEEDFDPNATTQSDFSDLPSGGWVQRIVGGAEYGVIFQESLIRRMEYVGSPVIFDLPAADRRRGTPIPNSVISFGRNVFYISEEGFFVFNGSSSEPIGNSRVDSEFWRIFDLGNKTKVSAGIDLINKLVCWGFPVSSDQPNTIFCYKWDQGRWSEIRDVDFDIIFNGRNQGFTLDGLDAVSTNIDTLSPSLDSDVWKGGKSYSGAFTRTHELASFDGDTLQALIQTGEQQLTPFRNSILSDVRPLVEIDRSRASTFNGGAFDIQVQVSTRDRLDATPIDHAAVSLNASGEANIDLKARYHRIATVIPAGADWLHARGVSVHKSDGGRHDGTSVS